MPIRVPQILAQTNPELGSAPHADPGALGAFAVAPYRGLSDVATTIQHAADQYAQVRDALTKEDMRLDVEDKLTQVRDRLAQEDVQLRQEGANPDQLAELFRQRGTRAISEVAKDLRYPQSAARFQGEANKALGHEVIKQRYEGLKLTYAHIGVLAGVQNQEDVNTAVFAALPTDRDEALGRITGRIGRLTATGVWSQEKATSETEGLLAQVEMGRTRVAARNPATRQMVLDGLLIGALRHVKPEAQLALADTLLREEEHAQKLRDNKAAKDAEAERKASVDDLDARADRGDLPSEDLETNRINRVTVGEDYRRLAAKLRAGGAAGGRTDDAVYNALELDLLANPLSHAPKEIRRIQEEGKLASSGPRSAATLLKLIGDETTKDITQQPLFREGLHDIRQSLRGGKGPMESLTGLEQGRLENAEREYHDLARSGKVGLGALPEEARRIIERKRRELPALLGGDPDARARLRYQQPGDLLKARQDGIISEAEFNRQFWLMESLGLFQKVEPTPAPGAAKPAPKGQPSGRR